MDRLHECAKAGVIAGAKSVGFVGGTRHSNEPNAAPLHTEADLRRCSTPASRGSARCGPNTAGHLACSPQDLASEACSNDDFVDLATDSPGKPGGVGASPRFHHRLEPSGPTDEDYDTILKVFRRRDIHCFFYTGGNGSMETALQISRAARDAAYELQVIGIPKTIDNDLAVTDHTPGYPSAARFFIHAARDIGFDNHALPSPICILEVLGRNTGWIAAATALARFHEDDAPHLIYFPERRLSLDRIAADVERVYRRIGRVVVAVCEGQLDEKGLPFGADVDRADSRCTAWRPTWGILWRMELTRKLGIRARAEKPGLLGRSCAALASPIDRKEARNCGRAAVEAALE